MVGQRIAIAAVLSAAVIGCSTSSSKDKGALVADQRWSEASDGLQIRLELPAGAARFGQTITARLHVRNHKSEPVRIYLIREDAFRSFQSRFRIVMAGKVVSVQPEPQPHGIVITEDEFPLIAGGATRTFEQRLDLSDPELAGGGTFVIEWTYENEIERWKGGAQTLDGPTKELFGGGRIPHIWIGKLTTSVELQVAGK